MAFSQLQRQLTMTEVGQKGKQEGQLPLQNFKNLSSGSRVPLVAIPVSCIK